MSPLESPSDFFRARDNDFVSSHEAPETLPTVFWTLRNVNRSLWHDSNVRLSGHDKELKPIRSTSAVLRAAETVFPFETELNLLTRASVSWDFVTLHPE